MIVMAKTNKKTSYEQKATGFQHSERAKYLGL